MSGIAPISTQPVQATESAGSTAAGTADAPSFQAQGAESSGASKSAVDWNPTAKEVKIFRTAAQETEGKAAFIENVKNAVDALKLSDPAFAKELGTSSPYSDPTKVDQYLSEQFAIEDKAERPLANPVDTGVSSGSARAAEQAREGALASAMEQQGIDTKPNFLTGSHPIEQMQGVSQQFGSTSGGR